MQGTDFNLEATKEHKKIAFKQGYATVPEHLRQASIAPIEQSPASCAQVNMPKNILEIEYLRNNLFDNNVHSLLIMTRIIHRIMKPLMCILLSMEVLICYLKLIM